MKLWVRGRECEVTCETGNHIESIILSENALKCKQVNPIHLLPMHSSKAGLLLYISFTAGRDYSGMLHKEHSSLTHRHTFFLPISLDVGIAL